MKTICWLLIILALAAGWAWQAAHMPLPVCTPHHNSPPAIIAPE